IAVVCNSHHMNGIARVFDLASGRELYAVERFSGPSAIEAAAISPDGRTIVTKQDFSVRVRDAATGKETRRLDLQRTNSWSMNELIAFTPDGKAIVVTSEGKVIHLIDFESGKTIRDFPHKDTVLSITFSHDNKLMAGGGYDSEKGDWFARLWEVVTGKELRRFRTGNNGYGIRQMAFSPDMKTLASGSDDGHLRLFDVDTGKERKAFPKHG